MQKRFVLNTVHEHPEINTEKLQNWLKHGNKLPFEGFPKGDIDKILNVSLPPFYTACPNPFLTDHIQFNSPERGHPKTQPFTQDISVGKNDPLYFAHSYSTKVPPHAIIPYILHYTEPGDLVFDGFCGTGMTGIASQLCEYPQEYFLEGARYGQRHALLVDLSPAATFIASTTNSLGRITPYLDEIENIIIGITQKYKNLLTTVHNGWKRGTEQLRQNAPRPHSDQAGHIEYIVWSDVFSCNNCGKEIIYWDLVFRGPSVPQPEELVCPSCSVTLTQRSMNRVTRSLFDHETGQTISQAKQVPVLINPSCYPR